ncbi:hypothetical protein GCM10029992_42920 [Glycomyces albus]
MIRAPAQTPTARRIEGVDLTAARISAAMSAARPGATPAASRSSLRVPRVAPAASAVSSGHTPSADAAAGGSAREPNQRPRSPLAAAISSTDSAFSIRVVPSVPMLGL